MGGAIFAFPSSSSRSSRSIPGAPAWFRARFQSSHEFSLLSTSKESLWKENATFLRKPRLLAVPPFLLRSLKYSIPSEHVRKKWRLNEKRQGRDKKIRFPCCAPPSRLAPILLAVLVLISCPVWSFRWLF